MITAASAAFAALMGYLNNRANHRIEGHAIETKEIVKAALVPPPDVIVEKIVVPKD